MSEQASRPAAGEASRLHALPAFSDNYIWALESGDGRCLVVDPGDAAPVQAFLAARGLALAHVLVTHHHADHVAGLGALRATGATVLGPAGEDIAGLDVAVQDGDTPPLPGFPAFRVLAVPGHTRGHIAWYSADAALLFCGDTLFSAGCGRLFEGTPAQMAASLARLDALPGDTRVCCAHEYTLANLRFAAAVEPGNADIAACAAAAAASRAAGRPTLPSTLALERRINPFLRLGEPAVQAAAAAWSGSAPAGATDCFAALRRWKDGFR